MTVLTARTKIRAIHLFCGGAECSPGCRGALLEVKAKLGCCINQKCGPSVRCHTHLNADFRSIMEEGIRYILQYLPSFWLRS